MTEPASDLQHVKYRQCVALSKQRKLAECTQVCLHNMTDPNILRYFHIKTLFLLSAAQDEDWPEVEVN